MRTLIIFLAIGLSYGSFFNRLDVSESGLSQRTVKNIAQDSTGRMWFSTYNGINMFDGYEITHYKSLENMPHLPNDNMAAALYTSSDGTVWAGLCGRLAFFNGEKNAFTSIPGAPAFHIFDFIEINDSTILASSTDHIYTLSTRRKELIPTHEQLSKIEGGTFGISDNLLYIGDNNGILHTYALSSSKYDQQIITRNRTPISDIKISDTGQEIWIGTNGDGLYRINLITGQKTHYTYQKGIKGAITSNHIRALCFDDHGKLWAGTGRNISIFNEETGDFTEINPDNETYKSSIYSILKDDLGGMWIGTYFSGVHYYHESHDIFSNISIKDDIVDCISYDPTGILWIGTNRNGIFRYDPEEHSLSPLRVATSPFQENPESGDLKAVYYSHDNNRVYFGTAISGILVYDRKSGQTSRLLSDGLPDMINCFLKYGTDSILIGSLSGLYIFNETTGRVTKVRARNTDINRIFCMIRNEDTGEMHLGTGKGIICGTLTDNGELINDHICSQPIKINDIYKSDSDGIWAATISGLHRYAEDRKIYESVTLTKNINPNLVGIEEDTCRNLWISTEDGLLKYSLSEHTIRCYTKHDGLESTTYNLFAHDKSPDGCMYFGNMKGISAFYPDQMKELNHSPAPIITRISSKHHEFPACSTNILLQNGETDLDIKFSVPDYASWRGNRFEYKLEGFNDTWITADPQRTASYTNLKGGDYTFKVRTYNASGKPCEKGKALYIKVRLPWYENPAVIFLLIASFIGITIAATSLIIRKHDKDNYLKIKEIQSSTQKDIMAMRLRQFTGGKAAIR